MYGKRTQLFEDRLFDSSPWTANFALGLLSKQPHVFPIHPSTQSMKIVLNSGLVLLVVWLYKSTPTC